MNSTMIDNSVFKILSASKVCTALEELKLFWPKAVARWSLVLSLVCVAAGSTGTAQAQDVVTDLLGNQLLCTLAERERASTVIEPLYQVADGQCNAVIPDSDAGGWFTDSSCTNPVTYTRTSMQDYCRVASDREQLGNGVGIRADSWTLTPGNQLDFGARSLDGVTQPYVQRLVYRRVQTPRGSCDLEMRVYKSHPAATGQRSMIALHGGSWTSRSFGYLGLELTIPHYVDQGFVVYAPFYRLLDDSDSSAACNQSDFNDIVDDADFALDWVADNAERFGSGGTPIVFGQSAGGHLALSLAVNRPEMVSGAVLMYPPADFADFLQRVQSGAYTNPQGLSILERVLDSGSDEANLSLPIVAQNSFPARVASEGADWPPMLIVQGSADELVESRQSARLCDALAGRVLPNTDQEAGFAVELRDVIGCGDSTNPVSELHLFRLGQHALDVCINDNIPDLCPSGSGASRSLVSQSISDAMNFSVSAHQAGVDSAMAVVVDAGDTSDIIDGEQESEQESEVTDANTDSADGSDAGDMVAAVSTGGGGGATGLLLLLLQLVLAFRIFSYATKTHQIDTHNTNVECTHNRFHA